MVLKYNMLDFCFELLDIDRFVELIDKTNAILKDERYTCYKPSLVYELGLKSGWEHNYTELV